MSKKILILEPSKTIQTIILEKTIQTIVFEKTDESQENLQFDIQFEESPLQFLASAVNTSPSAIFINADVKNPQGFELLRFIKTLPRVKKIPSVLYTTGELQYESFVKKNCGADEFWTFNEEGLLEEFQKVVLIGEEGKTIAPLQNDIAKTAISQRLVMLTKKVSHMDKTAQELLSLVTEFCEVPIAALVVLEPNSSALFYVSAEGLSDATQKQFLKVCTSEISNYRSDVNFSNMAVSHLACENLDQFYFSDIPLSAFQFVPIYDGEKHIFASLNVVRGGSFTTRQLDLLKFFAVNAGVILEQAIQIKQHIFFEKNIRKAFSRFVPEQIIDDLINESSKSEKTAVGEKRNVAILFSDIRSFTSISEANTPEVIVKFLNRYFTIMVNVIKKHGGTIDKFIGDAIMALFGAPVSYEDNTRRAVAAACEMRDALSSVPLDDLILPDGLKFNIGIGINYANVTVGSLGSEDKTDYTVIGDGVNLASRLEGLTKVYGSMILVSQFVKEDIKSHGEFTFRYLDDVKVKGKATGVPIFAVDKSEDEFSIEYRDSYAKGIDLYKQGIFSLAKEYFEKALGESPNDKAAKLLVDRCNDLILNPPDHWDGAFEFHTK